MLLFSLFYVGLIPSLLTLSANYHTKYMYIGNIFLHKRAELCYVDIKRTFDIKHQNIKFIDTTILDRHIKIIKRTYHHTRRSLLKINAIKLLFIALFVGFTINSSINTDLDP